MSKLTGHIREWLKAFLLALLTILILKTFVAGIYTIPSTSMEKTLLPGDVILVNKLSFGPRIPITPLTFPFTHQHLPFSDSLDAYIESLQLPYMRIPGYSDIKRNDILVFNYPGDRSHPVDHRSFYIKRCIGLPGDSLYIEDHRTYINGEENISIPALTYQYQVRTKEEINRDSLTGMGITEGGRGFAKGYWQFGMTDSIATILRKKPYIQNVRRITSQKGEYEAYVFPFDSKFPWNTDNYGPLYVPAKGDSIQLDSSNIIIYKNLLVRYEGADPSVMMKNLPQTYVFKMNYYFVMGDNRQNSSDSRFWGFLPESHIVGKTGTVLFSWDKSGNERTIRWARFFKSIE